MIEVLKQALKALEVSTDWDLNATGKQGKSVQAIISLRQAIAELESQEPVAMYREKCADGKRCLHGCHTNEPCYTHPPQRTEQEPLPEGCVVVARAVLNKLGIDNAVIDTIARNTPPAQPAPVQEPVACDGDFPEGFDASFGIPAQALRQANAALCEVTNNRMWDVPALAERMMRFRPHTTPPAQPAPVQEPVAYRSRMRNRDGQVITGWVVHTDTSENPDPRIEIEPLYTSPPAQPAQRKPLTDEEIVPMFAKRQIQETIGEKDAWYFYAWGVNDGEAAHGIKE